MRPHVLLRDSLADGNRAAIGTIVMRGKEYLAAIRAEQLIESMTAPRHPDDFRDEFTERVKERGGAGAEDGHKSTRKAASWTATKTASRATKKAA